MRDPRLSPGARGNSGTSLDSDAPVYTDALHAFQPFRAMGEVVAVALGPLRTPTEAEQHELRAMWWRQRRLGNHLPAEHGLIVLDGGVP